MAEVRDRSVTRVKGQTSGSPPRVADRGLNNERPIDRPFGLILHDGDAQ